MITCSKLYVTKIKYSQCQRTKDKTKKFVNVCAKTEFNPLYTPPPFN